jgi:hypothetical protein
LEATKETGELRTGEDMVTIMLLFWKTRRFCRWPERRKIRCHWPRELGIPSAKTTDSNDDNEDDSGDDDDDSGDDDI